MKIRNEIEELNAKFDHLQDRVDRLRDKIYENPKGKILWDNFNDLLAWSQKFDKNSEEYEIIIKAGWEILDLYLQIILVKGIK